MDIPEIMKEMRGVINFLRSFQYQFALPPNWATSFTHFPGLERSQGRSSDKPFKTSEKSMKKRKSDSTRKIAYEIVEEMLQK
jgi:hypothetical protein